MYGGDDGGPYALGYVLRNCGQFVPGAPFRTLLSASPTIWQGKPAIAVKVRCSSLDLVSTTYVDPANDYAALGFETETAIDDRVGVKPTTKPPIRREGVLTYTPSAEGVPLPTKYEFWFVLPDGRKQPQGVVEFLEYTRYTPTADDFDLEKQFGVKPPPEPSPTTETPGVPVSEPSHAGVAGWRSWWPTAVASVVVVLIMLLLAFRRRAA
jgi:hypothetical protein